MYIVLVQYSRISDSHHSHANPDQDPLFDADRDPDHAFHSNTDPDQLPCNADPDPQPCNETNFSESG
jgi:hypothetical protein